MKIGKGNEEEVKSVEELEMTREKAEELLIEWAKYLELDTKRALFKDLQDELTGVIENERLSFNEETEVFTYKLLKPVGGKSLIEIRETDFKEKKILQKYTDKEGIDSSIALMAKHTNFTFKEVESLKSRDQMKINAVVLGFLMQTATK